MAGNVAEWCADGWDPQAYDHFAKGSPPPDRGGQRASRGSWFGSQGEEHRATVRRHHGESDFGAFLGFPPMADVIVVRAEDDGWVGARARLRRRTAAQHSDHVPGQHALALPVRAPLECAELSRKDARQHRAAQAQTGGRLVRRGLIDSQPPFAEGAPLPADGIGALDELQDRLSLGPSKALEDRASLARLGRQEERGARLEGGGKVGRRLHAQDALDLGVDAGLDLIEVDAVAQDDLLFCGRAREELGLGLEAVPRQRHPLEEGAVVSSRLEPDALQLGGEPIRGALGAGRAGRAPVQVVRREERRRPKQVFAGDALARRGVRARLASVSEMRKRDQRVGQTWMRETTIRSVSGGTVDTQRSESNHGRRLAAFAHGARAAATSYATASRRVRSRSSLVFGSETVTRTAPLTWRGTLIKVGSILRATRRATSDGRSTRRRIQSPIDGMGRMPGMVAKREVKRSFS
jgi:hypothetical protein